MYVYMYVYIYIYVNVYVYVYVYLYLNLYLYLLVDYFNQTTDGPRANKSIATSVRMILIKAKNATEII